ncbi:MAG TPA: hypothetical protein VKS43_01580 [Burkholderiales bacterium]|nr:hypothetical protein [Burkholderiales bacterium]
MDQLNHRSTTDAGICAADINDDPYEGVARWLQEVGRRRFPANRLPLASVVAVPVRRWTPSRTARQIAGEGLALAALVAAYLQYYFLGVMLQVLTTRSVIVFALTAMN